MLIDLKKYFSGEDISQAIDYTVDLSEVEIDGCKPFVTPVQVKGSIRSFASSAELNVEVRYAYSMPCNRCLTLTRKELCHNISHVIVNKLNDEEDFEDDIGKLNHVYSLRPGQMPRIFIPTFCGKI